MKPSTIKMVRSISAKSGFLLDKICYLDFIFGYSTKVKSKISVKPTSVRLVGTNKLAIFATFNREEYWSAPHFFQELINAGFEIVIVNTGVPIHANSEHIIINRNNRGRDIFSYAIATIKFEETLLRCCEIMYLNDSVMWIEGALNHFLMEASNSNSQVTGMTESSQKINHIQTFAFHIKNPTNEILSVLKELKCMLFKRSIVRYGELKISEDLSCIGIVPKGLFKMSRNLDSVLPFSGAYGDDWKKMKYLIENEVNLNPSIHGWPLLLAKHGIYKKILENNPAKFKNLPLNSNYFHSMLFQFKSGFQK